MTGIVERLRRFAGDYEPTDMALSANLNDAADEIERMRAALTMSPGVAQAMEVFDRGLAARRATEFGLPWHVAPWGDGSKPPYVNICSEAHATVIAADLERDVANWIVNMVNATLARSE